MAEKKGLSSTFNRLVKGALAGGAVAIVGAAVLPFVAVSAPVVATGVVIGAIINGFNKP